MRHVFAIFGPTGSGKDTFADALELDLLAYDSSWEVSRVSSIDIVKRLFTAVSSRLEIPDRPLDVAGRQGLADVKKVLDRCFDWTVKLAIVKTPFNGVLLYQVREVENIKRLRLACAESNIGFTAVLLHRRGKDGLDGADTDIYSQDDAQIADLIVVNDLLEEMSTWAARARSRILQTGGNL